MRKGKQAVEKKGIEVETSSHPLGRAVGRRSMLQGIATLAGCSILPAVTAESAPAQSGAKAVAESSAPPPGTANTIIRASDSNAVVETNSGKVRGFTRNGINTFLGIPYAASPEAKARFQAPEKVTPWTGLRSSMQYGFVSPQEARAGWGNDEVAWMFDWDDGRFGEDCLRVNVWTPGVNDSKKRPVMVWLHGGGFSAGSGQELKSYYGENLSRRGDAVVVSLNHRLGVLGYLDLSQVGGPNYAHSANCGMLDIVAALEWVRDNIANFGGDPGNVMIFGQSGGGGKVNTLMAMPAAKGLFHRAAVQSGSLMNAAKPDDAGKLGAAVLQQLNLSAGQIDQIHDVPVDKLIAAGHAAVASLAQPFAPGRTFTLPRIGWQPTQDGSDLPIQPWDPTAPAQTAEVPVIVGTVLNEFSTGLYDTQLPTLTDAQLLERVKATHGDKSAHIIEVFRSAHPKAKSGEIFSRISAAPVRQGGVTQCERKAAQNAAPAYNYWFTWQTPVLDGRPGAFHCSELAFVFDNTDRCAPMTGGGPGPRALAAQVSDAWLHFARTGDPNHSGLPHWPAFTAAQCPTMIFDTECVMKNNPDGAERKALSES
jgi:para-nitrobenzyl esterase